MCVCLEGVESPVCFRLYFGRSVLNLNHFSLFLMLTLAYILYVCQPVSIAGIFMLLADFPV